MIAAQSLYQPIVTTALMIVSCHRSFWCYFPSSCQTQRRGSGSGGDGGGGGKRAASSPLYLGYATISALVLAFIGIGFLALLSWALWGRYWSAKAVVEERLRSREDDVLLSKGRKGGKGAAKGRGGRKGKGAADDDGDNNDEEGPNQEKLSAAELIAIAAEKEAAWREVMNGDRSIMRSLYASYTLRRMWVYPVGVLFKLALVFPVVLAPHGITVNMVSGGLLRSTDASSATPEAMFELIASLTPLRRVTTPAEFADAVLFFLSPWSRAVTGQNLIVDGGLVKG